jgi:hypothetical protein
LVEKNSREAPPTPVNTLAGAPVSPAVTEPQDDGSVGFRNAAEQQIPYGNDRKKGKCK